MLGAVYRAGRARLLIGGQGAFQPGPNREADMSELADVPPGVDPTRPSPARLYDYFLGGTNNFPADREAAEYLRSRIPDVADALWANRGFHGRAAVWMANHGIRQFLDIGSGLPTQNNTHESVHRIDPEARVVYVDNDPMVAAHAGALLDADGTTAVILADLRDPKALLSNPDLLRLIDLAEPAGILLTDVMHFVPDEEDPWGLVAQYMAACADRAATGAVARHRREPAACHRRRPPRKRWRKSTAYRPRASRGPKWRGSSRAWSWFAVRRRGARGHLRGPVGRRGSSRPRTPTGRAASTAASPAAATCRNRSSPSAYPNHGYSGKMLRSAQTS